MTSKLSEEIVQSKVEAYGLTCTSFAKHEMRTIGRKTPDRKVFDGKDLCFYLEIKEIAQDRWSQGLRNDPICNRLTDDIHRTIKQFDSVNPNIDFPNVLAWLNNDQHCGFNDLLAVLTGNAYTDDGSSLPIYRKYSHGRILNEKARVHLYLWYDQFRPNRILFSQTHEEHHRKLCNALSVDPDGISQIDA